MLAMHIPDGFIDAGRRSAPAWSPSAGVALCLRQAGRDARRAAGAARRPGRGLRLRRADAQLPGRQRHQRPPAGRRARRRARRAVVRRAVRHRRAASCRRCCSPTAGSARSGLNVVNMALVAAFGGYALFLGLRAAAPAAPRERRASPPASPPAVGVVARVDRLHARVRHRRHRRRVGRPPSRRDGRRARAHRHRRGGHHGADVVAPCSPSGPTSCTAPATCRRRSGATPSPATEAVA